MSEVRPEGHEEEIPVVDVVATREEDVVEPETALEADRSAIDADEAPNAAPCLSVGERLRTAREALGMTAADVAQALKLSTRQIDALEAGDWGKLPGTTIIRGFVRNYARVVQVPAEPLLSDLDAPLAETPRLDRPRTTTAVLPEPGRAQKRDYATVLAGLVFVALAVVAYFVVPLDFWQSAPKEAKTEVAATAPEPAQSAAALPGAPAPLFPPGTPLPAEVQPVPVPAAEASKPADLAAPTASAPVVANPTAPAGQLAPGSARVQLNFAQPSWVEIRDRTGQIIFSQLNQAGSQREVDGLPPFALVVGNAAHVTVQYKGRNIELQPRSKDDVARVTVE